MKKHRVIKILLLLFLLVILFFVAIYSLCLEPQDVWRGTREVVSTFIARGNHWILLCAIGGFAILALSLPIIEYVIPPILYCFGKIGSYISLWCICLRHRYGFRICRAPFRSLNGVDKKADIQITLSDKVFFLHFADVPLSLTKVLALINAAEYRVYATTPGKLNREGGYSRGANMSGQLLMVFRVGERQMNDQIYHSYELPEFPKKNSEYHFFIVNPGIAVAKYMSGQKMLDISAEVPVGNWVACRMKTMKKRLRGELHSPLDKLPKGEIR